jgi:hypothetical protein
MVSDRRYGAPRCRLAETLATRRSFMAVKTWFITADPRLTEGERAISPRRWEA